MDSHGADASSEETSTGEGQAPRLELDGFSGSLDRLLALARDHRIDLARLSLAALVSQMAAALERAAPLGQKADWLVMAAWLLHLRSQLLLPVDAPAHRAAAKQAGELRHGLVGLRAVQALAAWLDAQPQLGRDVFARGQPERVGVSVVAGHEATVIEFLWAAMALFDDAPSDPDAAPRYRPQPLDLHAVADARTRIMRLLAAGPDGQTLDRLLPERTGRAGGGTTTALKRRSAWASTFVASLELAKAGQVRLAQDEASSMVHVRPATNAIDRASR
jgi:segregation and condensation protein A